MTEFRAAFDADVTFRNGGGLQAQDFRLDVPSSDLGEQALADLFVRHLGLLMVAEVRLSGVRVIEEPHRGSRGSTQDPGAHGDRLVDLSHVITAGMTTYPGLPGPEITPHLTRERSREMYAPGTEFAIDRISMVGNTGTYLDSPFHRYPDGADLAGIALADVADVPLVVIRLDGGADRGSSADQEIGADRGIGPHAVAPFDVEGAAVLLHTGWSRHWGTGAYGDPAPFLTGDGARSLVERGARLVGIDSVNIDDAVGTERPAHSILLAAGVPVLEHLTNLDKVPPTGARLHAAPPPVAGFGTFPVRAYAVVPS